MSHLEKKKSKKIKATSLNTTDPEPVTITLAAFSCHQNVLTCCRGNFNADFRVWRSNSCKGNEIKFAHFHRRYGKNPLAFLANSHITIEVHHSHIVLGSDVPMQHCRQINNVQTFWPQTPVLLYTHMQKYSISCFPLSPQTHPREPA